MSLANEQTKKRPKPSSMRCLRLSREVAQAPREAYRRPAGEAKDCDVKSNIKSIPGVMTIRGCAYAGSKGVVWGPIKDMIHISHGPVGCGYYSWSGRRNYYIGVTGVDTFGTMHFTSDFQEKDIVFGGDKKLGKVIDEIKELFPLVNGISIQSECPIGLIGDDIEAVSQEEDQGNRQDDHPGPLRRLPRRFPVAGPPHRQRRRSATGCSTSPSRARRT